MGLFKGIKKLAKKVDPVGSKLMSKDPLMNLGSSKKKSPAAAVYGKLNSALGDARAAKAANAAKDNNSRPLGTLGSSQPANVPTAKRSAPAPTVRPSVKAGARSGVGRLSKFNKGHSPKL